MDSEKAIQESWYACIGLFITDWAHVERYIDLCTHKLHEFLIETDQVKNSYKRPWGVSKRLDFISAHLDKILPKDPDFEFMEQATRSVVIDRNIYVHGVIEYLDTIQITINKVDDKPKHDITYENHVIRIEDLNDSMVVLRFILSKWKAIENKLYADS